MEDIKQLIGDDTESETHRLCLTTFPSSLLVYISKLIYTIATRGHEHATLKLIILLSNVMMMTNGCATVYVYDTGNSS